VCHLPANKLLSPFAKTTILSNICVFAEAVILLLMKQTPSVVKNGFCMKNSSQQEVAFELGTTQVDNKSSHLNENKVTFYLHLIKEDKSKAKALFVVYT